MKLHLHPNVGYIYSIYLCVDMFLCLIRVSLLTIECFHCTFYHQIIINWQPLRNSFYFFLNLTLSRHPFSLVRILCIVHTLYSPYIHILYAHLSMHSFSSTKSKWEKIGVDRNEHSLTIQRLYTLHLHSYIYLQSVIF